MDSILVSIRRLLGGDEYCNHFDAELITYTNMVLSELTQLGVGPSEGFLVKDETQTWSEITDDLVLRGLIESYVTNKVKLTFDPSSSSAVIESLKQVNNELVWRISVRAEEIAKSKTNQSLGEGGISKWRRTN